MSERLPNPDTLTRQPSHPSAGGDATVIDRDAVSPEDAVKEAREARENAERERDAANAREQAARRERDEAQRRATDAGSQAWTAQGQAIETSISAQNEIIKQARTAIATAQAAGDAEAVADAFVRLSQAQAALLDFGNRKAWIEQQKAQKPAAEAQPRTDGTTVTTPGGTMQVAAPAKQWMDAHPRFYNDAGYYNHAVAAHSTITADGIQEGTPAYFRALDDQMTRFERFEAFERGDGGDQVSNSQQQRPAPQRRASSMGAPVSRSSASVTNSNGQIDPLRIAQRLGNNVTIDDLREAGRIAGFMKNPQDEAGFQKYLAAHQEIYEIDRAGGDTGLRSDQVYR